MNVKIKNYGIIVLAIILTGLGSSLMMKANLGINAYDGMAKSVSTLLSIKVGTIAMSINLLFFFIQVVMLGKKVSFDKMLQMPIVILLGFVINFFMYTILGNVNVNHYVIALIFFCVGLVLVGFSCALLLHIHIGYPLEGFCQLVAEKYRFKFSVVRQGMDVISAIVIVILFLWKDIPIPIREGTIISILVFGPLVQYFMKLLKKDAI